MYKNRNIFLISFATLDLKRSIKRFEEQAISSNYYDKINIITPKKLSEENREKINFHLKLGKKRGYAYWYWKPLILLDFMNKIEDNDIVHYLDIGFHIISDRAEKFYLYLDQLFDGGCSLVTFQYLPPLKKEFKDIIFPQREEFKYTKADLFEYFGKLNDKNITHTAQFSAGNIFLKKDQQSLDFLNDWKNIFEKRFDLVDDTKSKIQNFENFIENRHDQSIFSILSKMYAFKPFSAYEFDWAEKKNQRTWIHNNDSPFLAKRDLKYNIFKRFINRQFKTYRRYKKLLLS